MTSQVNAILIHESDNVVTTLVEIPAGECARYRVQEEIVEIVARETIPAFHKIALKNIPKMDPVRKYGEIMGQAIVDIRTGDHVHEHNIVSPGRA